MHLSIFRSELGVKEKFAFSIEFKSAEFTSECSVFITSALKLRGNWIGLQISWVDWDSDFRIISDWFITSKFKSVFRWNSHINELTWNRKLTLLNGNLVNFREIKFLLANFFLTVQIVVKVTNNCELTIKIIRVRCN